MRAIVFDEGLRFAGDHPEPVCAQGEALVKVSCAGVCATDIEITKGYMGFTGILGHEFSGRVVSKGGALSGRRVVGEINVPCARCALCGKGLERHCPKRTVIGIYGRDGAFADYVSLPESNLHPLPDSVSDREAVFVEPIAAAFEILEQVSIDKDTRVAVIGDGRLGLLIAQVMALSRCNLTVIGRHSEKLSTLDAMAIDTKVGYDGLGREFDVVIDAAGTNEGLASALDIVVPKGTIVLKTTVAGNRDVDLNRVVIDEVSLVGSRCGPFAPAIEALAEGKVKVGALIDSVFKLEDGVHAIERASQKGVLKVLLEM
ncbi:MAG: alcohol dehydrogenase catalytic domain-containing protein [Deltaproteobacteria bacterium]